jgi:hypothetical protein
MSDLRTLEDAFAELERRADAAATGTAPVVRQRRAVRLVPVAATVVAVAGLVAGVVWLVPGDSGTPTAGPPTAPSTTQTRSPFPTSLDGVIARFKVVLGDTATFEVTQKGTMPRTSASAPPGPEPSAIRLDGPDGDPFFSGTLTSAGATGGFGLMIASGDFEPGRWCGYSSENCQVSTLPDGSRLATGTTKRSPGAVAYLAVVKRPDGTAIVLNVSNQEDPSGAVIGTPGGRVYSPQPPLNLDQMKAIVTSDKW